MCKEQDYKMAIDFMQAVPQSMDRGKKYNWTCPLCGGMVTGSRSEYNRHLHAKCLGCGFAIMQ